PDGRWLAIAQGFLGKGFFVRVLDAKSGELRYRLEGHEQGVLALAFSPDSTVLASGDAYSDRGGYDGRVCLWNMSNGKRLREIRGTKGIVRKLCFSGDGRTLLANADRLLSWDVATGEERGELRLGGVRARSMALSPDGRLLLTVADRGPSRLFELATGGLIHTLPAEYEGDAAEVAPDGRRVAQGGIDGAVRLFDCAASRTLRTLRGRRNYILALAFSPDGTRLVSGGDLETSAVVWDVTPTTATAAQLGAADFDRLWGRLRGE